MACRCGECPGGADSVFGASDHQCVGFTLCGEAYTKSSMTERDAPREMSDPLESSQRPTPHLGDLVASVTETPARIRKGLKAFIEAVAEPVDTPALDQTETLSLETDGDDIGANLALLASGGAKVADLGPGYFRAPDGTIGVRTDVSPDGSVIGLREEFWQGDQPDNR